MNCGTCRFWNSKWQNGTGECRRFPPIVVFNSVEDTDGLTGPETQFPWTAENEWCGEHQAEPNSGIVQ